MILNLRGMTGCRSGSSSSFSSASANLTLMGGAFANVHAQGVHDTASTISGLHRCSNGLRIKALDVLMPSGVLKMYALLSRL